MAEMVPLIEAAHRLGVSVDAIRRRIRRGTIHAEKREDRWFVEVPDEDSAQHAAQATAYDAPSPPPPVSDAMVQAMIVMQCQMDLLNGELAVKNQQLAEAATERAELRRLLGNAQQTVQQLTGGTRQDGPGPAQGSVTEEPAFRPAQTPQRAAERPQRASWRWPWVRRTG